MQIPLLFPVEAMHRPPSSSQFTSHRGDEQQCHSHPLHLPPPPLSPRSALRSLQGNDSSPRVSNNGQSDATDRRRSSGQHYAPSVMSQPLPKPAGTSATVQQQQQQQQAAYTNQRHLSLPSPSWAADGQLSTSPSTSPSLVDLNGPRSPAAPLELPSASRRRSMLPPRTSREVNHRYTVPFPPALTQRGSHSSLQSSHSATSSPRASLVSLPLATPPESQYSPDYPSFPSLASKHRRLTQEEPGHTRLPRRQASIPRNMRASPRFTSEQDHPFAYSIDDSSPRVSWTAGQPADIDGPSSSKAQQGDGEYITPPASRFPQLQQHHSYPEWTPSFDRYQPQGSSSPYKRPLDSQPIGPRRSVRSFDDYMTSSTQSQQPRPRLLHQSSSHSSYYGEIILGPTRSNSSIASTQSPISDIHMGRRDLDDGPSASSSSLMGGGGRMLAPLKRSPGIPAHQATSLPMSSSPFVYPTEQQQRSSLQPMVASPEQVRTVARTQQTSPKVLPSVLATATAASASRRVATHPPVSPAVWMDDARQITQDDGAFEAKLSQARRAPEASLAGPRYPPDQVSYPAAPALVAPRRPSDHHHQSVRSQSADRAGNPLPEKKDLNHVEVMAKLNRKMKERLAIKASSGGQTLDGRFSPSSPAAIALERGRGKGRHRGDSNASSSVASSTISASATSTSTVDSSPRQSLESLEARAGRTSAHVIGIESLLSAAALSDGMAAQQTQQAATPNKFFAASSSVSVAERDRDPQQGRGSPRDTAVPA